MDKNNKLQPQVIPNQKLLFISLYEMADFTFGQPIDDKRSRKFLEPYCYCLQQ
jgi:hypothetical protein